MVIKGHTKNPPGMESFTEVDNSLCAHTCVQVKLGRSEQVEGFCQWQYLGSDVTLWFRKTSLGKSGRRVPRISMIISYNHI